MSGPVTPSAASFSGEHPPPVGLGQPVPEVGTLCDRARASRRNEAPPRHRAVLADRSFAQLQPVAEQGRVPEPPEHLLAFRRITDLHDVRDLVQRHPLQHPRQAETVVPVKVGDADAGDLAGRDPGEQHLPLGSLARVEQQALVVPAQEVPVVIAATGGRLARRAENHQFAIGHGT